MLTNILRTYIKVRKLVSKKLRIKLFKAKFKKVYKIGFEKYQLNIDSKC